MFGNACIFITLERQLVILIFNGGYAYGLISRAQTSVIISTLNKVSLAISIEMIEFQMVFGIIFIAARVAGIRGTSPDLDWVRVMISPTI